MIAKSSIVSYRKVHLIVIRTIHVSAQERSITVHNRFTIIGIQEIISSKQKQEPLGSKVL